MNRPIAGRPMVLELGSREPVRLGNAIIDLVSRDARWPGGEERLQPQTLKVLIALVRKRGEVVTRDELVELCWGGRIIGEDVINRSISLARHLAARAGGFSIETVPRAGYRLIEEGAGRKKQRRWFVLAGAAAIAVALVAIAAFMLVSRTAEAPTSPASVALLPFTADPSDADARKLAVAAHDAVAHALSQGNLSLKTIDTTPQGSSAPADFLITGQVNGALDKFVVSVRTEETAHQVVVGSDQFEASREKAWKLPERVGANVASGLAWMAPLFALERRHPDDPAVAASLLRSSSATLVTVDALHDYEKSRRLAAKAPNSPLAQYSLAFNTVWALGDLPTENRSQAVADARLAATRTLKFAPEFGAGYILECLLHSEQRRVQCEDSLRAGTRADPSDPFSPWFLSRLLSDVGRNEEALEFARISVALDQYRTFRIGLMLRMLEIAGQTAEAEDLYQRSMRWFPGDYYIIWYRGGGMLLRGDFEAAERFEIDAGQRFKREIIEQGRFETHHAVRGLASAMQANSAIRARSACAHVAPEDDSALQCMLALARVGDLNGAYRYAAAIYPARRGRTPADEERIWLANPRARAATAYLAGPSAAPLRRDPRYMALAERVGLLEYWRSGRPPDFCRKDPEPICAQLLKTR